MCGCGGSHLHHPSDQQGGGSQEPPASHSWSKTALEETSKSPAQKSEGSFNTENKLVNRVEEEISDMHPETAAAAGQASRSSSQQEWAQEHQHSSQHLMGPEPAGDAQEPGAQEAQEREGPHSKTGDVVQHPGSDVSVSQRQELRGQVSGLQQTCRPALEQESWWEASQWSLGQDSCHSPQRVSREGSWQSLGPDSCLGDEPWQSGWQTLRQQSPLSTDSKERLEQVRRVAYSPEEGMTWISQKTTREVTNRSQQTSQVWSKKAATDILKCPAQKSKTSVDTGNKLVNGVEKEISDKRPETTRQPTRQASRHGSEKLSRQESRCSSHQVSGQQSWHSTKPVSRQQSRGSSQQALGQQSGHGSEKVPGQQSRRGSQQALGQQSRHGSEKVPGQEPWCDVKPVSRQESRRGSEQVPEQQPRPHQPGEAGSEQPDKQSEGCALPSDSSLLLVLQLECGNLQGIEVVVEEQTAESWRKRNQARAERALQLSQGSTAGLGEAEQTCDLLSLEGGTWVTRTGKILISRDEETGDTVIQRIHETAQLPARQQSQKEGATGVPEACSGAEMLQVVGHETWQSGGADRSREAASGLPAASHSPGGVLSMAVSREVVHEAQQTQSVISLDEGLWLRRRTGKLLKNKSQQTGATALQKSSSTVQERREAGCCGSGEAAGGCTSGQQEGGKPQTHPSDVDVPELRR
ncbi:hypothetical protein GRJ2_001587600 [Grus japonensis]|uniref:Uncharacterized protein n=1 Tax=Grus japonensis TaxID=30415 RepID=A0ABC9X0M0_GRUJA